MSPSLLLSLKQKFELPGATLPCLQNWWKESSRTTTIPINNTNIFVIKRDVLLGALKRTAILANAKLRGVKWELKNNTLTIQSTNSDQEEAKDVLDIEYNGIDIEIGFNLLYLQDVLNNLRSEEVQFALHSNTGAMLVTMPDNSSFKYVVMPMRT